MTKQTTVIRERSAVPRRTAGNAFGPRRKPLAENDVGPIRHHPSFGNPQYGRPAKILSCSNGVGQLFGLLRIEAPGMQHG